MTRVVPRERTLAVMCAVLAVVPECGGTGGADRAVSNAGKAAREMTDVSQQLMRAWCPQALAGGGRDLTGGQARACLQRAKNAYLHDLRAGGYNPANP